MSNVGIKNSWSLVDFAKANGQLKLTKEFVNPNTGETFRSLAFVNGQNVTLVGFSSNLGELTPNEIVTQKNELQVVELETGNYKLCKSSSDHWETIDLGL